MQIVEKALGEIRPYTNNPRNNAKAVDKVAESIRAFGFKVPIVIDKDGEIVAGHTRYQAAIQLGLSSVPCITADDLNDEEVRAFRLADNKVAEFASWDADALLEELKAISGIDMTAFGFPEEPDEADPEDFDPEPPKKATSKEGEIYQLGEHVLMVGDATAVEDVRKLTGGVPVQCVITDPPYNVDYTGKTKDALKIENDAKDVDDFIQFLTAAFRGIKDALQPGAAFYIWHAHTAAREFSTAAIQAGLETRQMLVWAKNIFALSRQDYQWRHEACMYGWRTGAAHYFVNDRTETTVIDDTVEPKKLTKAQLVEIVEKIQAQEGTVLYEDKPSRNALHPTMKPVKLIARLLRNSTRPGDTVLDTFGGSGTTLIACEQMGRRCRIMEKDPRYADVIIKRWEEYTGRQAERVDEKEQLEKKD